MILITWDPLPSTPRVWALSLGTPMSWQELLPGGTPPRAFGSTVYDSRRRRIVGYGGIVYGETSSMTVPDLWALDLAGAPAWTALTAASPPAFSRIPGAAAYDSTGDRMLIQGGWFSNGVSSAYLEEAWQLSFSGTPTWTQLSPAGGDPGSAGGLSAFDDVNGRMVMAGQETWTLEFPGGIPTWIQAIHAGIPVQQQQPSMLLDPIAQRLVLLNGTEDYPWTADLSPVPGGWNVLSVAGIVPPGSDPVLVPAPVVAPPGYDPRREAFRILTKDREYAGFELADEGILRWRRRGTTGGSPVFPAFFKRMIAAPFDSVRKRTYPFNTDTLWTLADGPSDTWTRQKITGSPMPSRQSGLVFLDHARSRILVFGGRDEQSSSHRQDLWSLSLGNPPTWTQMAPTCPVCGYDLVPIAHDTRRDRLIFTGGVTTPGVPMVVWAFDLATSVWTQLTPSEFQPETRREHAAVYDTTHDRVVLVGGKNTARSMTDELWGVAFTPEDSVGTWLRYDLGAQRLPDASNAQLVQAAEDGAYHMPWGDRLYTIRVGAPAGHLTVTAPSPWAWVAGSITALPLEVTNLGGASTTVRWRVFAERSWPGFPLSGTTAVPGLGTKSVPTPVPVPDTAAYGAHVLHVVVEEVANPSSADSILVELVDPLYLKRPTLTAPGDWTWHTGTSDLMRVTVTNPDHAGHSFVVRWNVHRDWPGFPGSLPVDLGQESGKEVIVPFVVPDTAAAGVVPMHLTVERADRPEIASGVEVRLHDGTTATRIAFVSGDRDARTGVVRILWWVDAAGSVARIQRREGAGEWREVGTATVDASGLLEWVDREPPLSSLAYRAGVTDEEGVSWSAEIRIAALRPAALSFASSRPLRGAFDVDFLADPSRPVTLEAFDVRGRRSAFRRVVPVAGINRVRLAPAGTLRSGIYFVRLSQGGQRADGRYVLLSGGP